MYLYIYYTITEILEQIITTCQRAHSLAETDIFVVLVLRENLSVGTSDHKSYHMLTQGLKHGQHW